MQTTAVFREVPDTKAAAQIRARSTFTDGKWKCPRTCTDADLLVFGRGG